MEVMRRVTSGEGTGTVSNGLNSANDLPSVHRGANRCKIKNINVWWLGCVLALLIPANLFSPLAGLGSRILRDISGGESRTETSHHAARSK